MCVYVFVCLCVCVPPQSHQTQVSIPKYQYITSMCLFDTFKILENCTVNFCMANYYFLIKINQDSSMKLLKNEFSDF